MRHDPSTGLFGARRHSTGRFTPRPVRRRELDGDQPDGPDLWLFALGFTIGAAIAGVIVYVLLRGWFA